MTCPRCSAPVNEAAAECPSCGVVVAKWHPPPQRKITASRPLPKRWRYTRYILPIVAGASLALALAIVGYWYYTSPPEDVSYGSSEVETGNVLRRVNTRTPGFDVAYELPESGAIASDGRDLIVGRLRLQTRGDEGFFAQQLSEPRMKLAALTWNGKEYIGLSGDVFATLARNTLRPLGTRPAPTSLGCLAWDGQWYWAATRIHPAILYKLDRDFNIVSTGEAPGACHGLAWDGNNLWLGGDSIHVIDVSGQKPRVLHTEKSSVPNLSGIVAFNRHIWVTDSDRNLLQRLAPALRKAWTTGGSAPVVASSVLVSGDNLAALRLQIRSSDWRERVRAKVELQKMGTPIDFDRHENRYVERKPNDAEVIDWSIELRDGTIYGSWKLWFGPELLKGATPPSYSVTVHPPDGSADVQSVFNAKAGENAMRDVSLSPASAPGDYRVDLALLDRTPSTLTVGVAATSVESARSINNDLPVVQRPDR